MRDALEFWILPVMNPDGIVCGNYRCNTQGKDMNRYFFSSKEDVNMRLTEVELIRTLMENHFDPSNKEKRSRLKMFLDIHAHSAQRDIFIFAPNTHNASDMAKVRNFPTILNDQSQYFNIANCKFANEQYKKNCARLAVIRDFNLFHSYTIESSCWGYSIPYTDDVVQFKDKDFTKFGKHLSQGIAKQFSVSNQIEDEVGAEKGPGLDITLDFGNDNLRDAPEQPMTLKKKMVRKVPAVKPSVRVV